MTMGAHPAKSAVKIVNQTREDGPIERGMAAAKPLRPVLHMDAARFMR
jgi:hypothetical protein